VTQTRTSIVIDADPQTIYRFASATERWPEYLPHYRYVRVIQDDGASRIIEMAAWRDFIPVRWVARQTNDPARPHIAFKHLAGWTKGMDVEWRFEGDRGGTRVTIEHRLAFQFPIAADFIGKHVVAAFFIENVAKKTLARMKALAEVR